MAEDSRGWLFRKRTVLGGALLAGIGLGIYIGKFNGLGWGPGDGKNGENNGQTRATTDTTAVPTTPVESSEQADPKTAPKFVRVVVDEHNYLLREGGKEESIQLPQLIKLIEKAPGDEEGIRVKIYQKLSARMAALEEIKKELNAAGIPDTAIFWVPPAQN